MSEAFSPLGLVIAGLVGLAVGIEREWSGHASGPGARFAGARTFFLIGLVGGLAGLLSAAGLALPATAILLGVAALAVAAYVTAARRGGDDAADGTTEAAALAVLAPPDTLVRLMEHKLDVCGVRVHRRYPPFDPIFYRGKVGEYLNVSDEEAYSGDLIEVDATGTGCLLFNMELFDNIEFRWFEFCTMGGRLVRI